MNRYLPPEVYERYLSTYSSANVSELWRAVWEMCRLFEETALDVSERLYFAYQKQEAESSRHSRIWIFPAAAKAMEAVWE